MDCIDTTEIFSSIASRLVKQAPMPKCVDDFKNEKHRGKKFWTDVLDEALGAFARRTPPMSYCKNGVLHPSAMKNFSDKMLTLSRRIESLFDQPRTCGRPRAQNQLTSAKFLQRVQSFVESERHYDAIVERGGTPLVVSEVEWLLGQDEFLVDFVKLLYVKHGLKLFVHRCPDERRAALPILREFMSCFTDHVEGETYLVILAMDFKAPGHTIGHYFTVPRSGRLSMKEIAFQEIDRSPHSWPLLQGI